MRKSITTLLTATLIAVPVGQATAATKTTKRKVVTRKFTGSTFEADRYGALQVTIVVRKTTVKRNGRASVTRKITSIGVPVYPNETGRSVFISQNALPILRSEALRAQSARIDLVSGATYTSEAFASSLQSAILKARRA
jgi:uncharacterized protein with FMN-binding domain